MVPVSLIARKDETDLSIELVNGSVIALRGGDNPDSLRGVGLDFLVLDEFASIAPAAWFEVLRPALADKQGKALFIGTPSGFNWAYDLYQSSYSFPGWQAWQFTTLEGGNVSQEELEAAKSTMDERTYRQEFLASFEALTGRVYDKFDRAYNCREVVDNGTELLVGMDFNISPMSAVIAIAAGHECHVLDCIELMASNTEEMASEIKRRYPNRPIVCYPDPSGRSGHSNAPVGQTDFTILKRHGFRIAAPPRAPLVPDKINAVQAMLCSADGTRRALIHPRAKALIKGLEGHTYKDGTSLPDKSSGLDHMPDAFAYMIWSRFNLLRSFGAHRSGIQLY